MAPHGLAADSCDLSDFKTDPDYRYEKPPQRYLFHKNTQEQLTLTLETSQRTSHRITTAIFKIFIKEILNFQDVEVVHVNDEEFKGWEITYQETNMIEIPTTMLNLEVWLPPGTVETSGSEEVDKGSQGSGGRFGWYISNHSIGQNDCITDHWRSYQYEKCSKIFSLTPQENNLLIGNYTKTGDGFYCNESFCTNGIFTPAVCENNNNCATLFAGDYKRYTKFLVEQIKDQDLQVRVAWIGPNLNSNFVKNFRKSNSIMFFGWWPDSLSNLGGFIPISFQPCSDYKTESRNEKTYACKYELHPLKKHMWKEIPQIDQNIPVAVEKFSLSIEDYRQLLTMYNDEHSDSAHDHDHDDNKVIDDIACRWLQGKKRTLNNWLPPAYSDKIKLWIGGIFPMSSQADFQQNSLLNAAALAKERINKNDNILSDYEIEIINDDGKCQSDMVLKAFITYTKQGIDNGGGLNKIKFDQMIGVLGPSCSDTVEPLVGVAKHFNTVIVSYSAEGAIFNNSDKYPYFFRTIPGNKMYSKVYPELFSAFGWKQVASLAENNNKYSEYLTFLEDDLIQRNMSIVNSRFQRDARADLTTHLQKLKKSNHRIIIGDLYATTARHVLCQAHKQKMTAKDGFIWFLPRWFHADWYKNNTTRKEGDEIEDCTTQEMEEAINGTFSLGYAYFAENKTEIMKDYENITVKEWHEEWSKKMCGRRDAKPNCWELPNYAGYTYDAVWTYAIALNKLLAEDKSHAVNMHSKKTNTRFVKLIDGTNFTGVSGHIIFHDGPSRQTNVNVMQLQIKDGKFDYVTVGYYDTNLNASATNKNRLKLNETLIKWQTSDGKAPDDGSPPEQTCLFSSISDALGVNCEMAIFISMLFGFAVITIIVFAAFIVFKKNMEKRIPPPGTRLWDSLDEWEIPREKVVINRTIGEGAFGTVFGGECQFTDNGPWQAVAVKTLKVGSTIEEKLDFLSEAEMMKRFSHKNIVELLGVCTHHEPIYMIMEFMLYGDLKTYLLARRHLVTSRSVASDDDEVGPRRLTSMALDVSRALDYLSEQKYVHRDVACRNCLVSADRIVKLSDFGMTRAMYESDYYRFNRKAMLPVRWMSPESLEEGVFTCKSDMWSFGVLLYEIITFGNFPFQGMSNNQVLEHVCKGHTIALPNGVKPQLSRLLHSSWALEPDERPSFSQMVDQLAMNPRLITPCLEVPLASVQTETDSLVITDQSNHKVPPRPPAPARVKHYSGDTAITPANLGNHQNNLSPGGNPPRWPPYDISQVPTYSDTGTGTTTTSFTVPNIWNNGSYNCNHNRAPHINGGGSSIEPLLPQNGENYIAKYVCLQRSKSGDSPVTIETPNMTSV